MTKHAGKDFWVEIQISGEWYQIPGQRTTTGAITNEQVDTTDKDGVPWRDLTPCGIRMADVSIAGVCRDDVGSTVFGTLLSSAFNGDVVQISVLSNADDSFLAGPHVVSAMERAGEYNGAETYNITFASAGAEMTPGSISFSAMVDTTKTSTGSTASNAFKLPLVSDAVYAFTADWGDGTTSRITAYNQAEVTHTYASPGTYNVRLRGRCSRLKFEDTGDKLKLLDIQQWGQIGLTSLNAAFWGCANLVITAVDHAFASFNVISDFFNAFRDCSSLTSFPTLDTSNVWNFVGAWYGCSGLTAFPALNTSKATTLQGTWQRCSNLASFPWIDTSKVTNFHSAWYLCSKIAGKFPAIDTSKGTNFNSTWRSCSKITEFDASLDTHLATTVPDCWNGCTLLASFPWIDLSSATDVKAAWYKCNNLSSFPAITLTSDPTKYVSLQQAWAECFKLESFPFINTERVNNFSSAWSDCHLMTSFPNIDTSLGTNFSGTWYNCYSLTSFPAIDTRRGINFNRTWSLCNGLSGVMPTFDMRAMTSGGECFPTLSTAIYNSILDQLANGRGAVPANPNNSVTFGAVTSKYNETSGGYDGTASRLVLTTAPRSWTITDGGHT